MANYFEILPGIGIGKLRFGMWRSDVEKLLGPPDGSRAFDYQESGSHIDELWTYETYGLELMFDESCDYRLASIKASHPQTTLGGTKLFGLDVEEALGRMFDLGYEATEKKSFPESKLQICFDKQQIDLWFQGGFLETVEWGHLWLDNQTPRWPDNR